MLTGLLPDSLVQASSQVTLCNQAMGQYHMEKSPNITCQQPCLQQHLLHGNKQNWQAINDNCDREKNQIIKGIENRTLNLRSHCHASPLGSPPLPADFL